MVGREFGLHRSHIPETDEKYNGQCFSRAPSLFMHICNIQPNTILLPLRSFELPVYISVYVTAGIFLLLSLYQRANRIIFRHGI